MTTRSPWVLLFGLWLCACGGPPKDAPVYHPASLTDPKAFASPFWLLLEEGDELPVHVDVEGPLFVMKPPEPLVVRVKKTFYLLIGDGKPRISFDRRTFADGGGSFSFAIGNSVERGPHISVVIRHAPSPQRPPGSASPLPQARACQSHPRCEEARDPRPPFRQGHRDARGQALMHP